MRGGGPALFDQQSDLFGLAVKGVGLLGIAIPTPVQFILNFRTIALR